jgi:hypothetical protein
MIGLPYSHFGNPEAGPCPIWEATGRIHWILENHTISETKPYVSFPTALLAYQIIYYIIIYIYA